MGDLREMQILVGKNMHIFIHTRLSDKLQKADKFDWYEVKGIYLGDWWPQKLKVWSKGGVTSDQISLQK